jgi:hypothetical protein
MFGPADMVVKEVAPPMSLWCKSGHEAPAMFRRRGTKAPEEPTKFFRISCSHDPHVNGIYCEPCLIIANAMKDQTPNPKPKIGSDEHPATARTPNPELHELPTR